MPMHTTYPPLSCLCDLVCLFVRRAVNIDTSGGRPYCYFLAALLGTSLVVVVVGVCVRLRVVVYVVAKMKGK